MQTGQSIHVKKKQSRHRMRIIIAISGLLLLGAAAPAVASFINGFYADLHAS